MCQRMQRSLWRGNLELARLSKEQHWMRSLLFDRMTFQISKMVLADAKYSVPTGRSGSEFTNDTLSVQEHFSAVNSSYIFSPFSSPNPCFSWPRSWHLQVMNLSTPANYFHALRRQQHRDFRISSVGLRHNALQSAISHSFTASMRFWQKIRHAFHDTSIYFMCHVYATEVVYDWKSQSLWISKVLAGQSNCRKIELWRHNCGCFPQQSPPLCVKSFCCAAWKTM